MTCPGRFATPRTVAVQGALRLASYGVTDATAQAATRTPVPSSLKVSAGSSSHSPPRASTIGRRLAFCRGPFAHKATRRPPGFSIVSACLICAMSAPCTKGGFINTASNMPRSSVSALHCRKSAHRTVPARPEQASRAARASAGFTSTATTSNAV